MIVKGNMHLYICAALALNFCLLAQIFMQHRLCPCQHNAVPHLLTQNNNSTLNSLCELFELFQKWLYKAPVQFGS